MGTVFDSTLFGHLFTNEAVREAFGERAQVQGWLDVEAALAQAQAELGVIPEAAARVIREKANADLFDFDALRQGITDTGHPIVPMIRQLVDLCGEHGGWVHWGTTTQDIMDTGLVLQLRVALGPIQRELDSAVAALTALAPAHARTMMVGRTHAQHAIPIPFGHKVAVWADELLRARTRLERAASEALVASLAGAAGTLATLPETGSQVRKRFCEILGLGDTVVPWHTSRDRLRDLLFALDHIATASERIGAEIVRMQSTEVAELAEPPAAQHIGSSTMPQKRNPFAAELMYVDAKLIHSLVAGVMSNSAHAYERDMMSWAMEWFAIPSVVMLTSGTTDKLAFILSGIEVSTDQMRRNLASAEPEIMAEAIMMELAADIGHENAHALVHSAVTGATEDQTMLEVLLANDTITGEVAQRLTAAADPSNYRGLVDEYIAHVTDNSERTAG